MSEIINTLLAEADRLEAAFLTKLTRSGLEDIIDDYKEISRIREVAAGFARRTSKVRAAKNGGGNTSNAEPLPPLPEGFVLREEVRRILPEMKKDRFRVSDVFELLAERFPNTIVEERRASVGATLSNLVPKELKREQDNQRKIWFRVIENEEEENSPPVEEPAVTAAPSVWADSDDIPF